MRKKRARGQTYVEGQAVKTFDGKTGTIISVTKKRGAWHYSVMMDERMKVVLHSQDELEGG